MKISNHYFVHRKVVWYCKSIILQLKKKIIFTNFVCHICLTNCKCVYVLCHPFCHHGCYIFCVPETKSFICTLQFVLLFLRHITLKTFSFFSIINFSIHAKSIPSIYEDKVDFVHWGKSSTTYWKIVLRGSITIVHLCTSMCTKAKPCVFVPDEFFKDVCIGISLGK